MALVTLLVAVLIGKSHKTEKCINAFGVGGGAGFNSYHGCVLLLLY